MTTTLILILLLTLTPAVALEPIVRAVDLNLGESAEVTLADGSTARVKLLDLIEEKDSLRGAIRSATVTVEINGEAHRVPSGNYHLPQTLSGVQIDCPITKGYRVSSNRDMWALTKDARLRLWPAESPLITPGTFVYPLKQRWFATYTQMANEPTYVDGPENPRINKIYYHNDLDFGGAEGMVDVVAATDGLVVSSGENTLQEHRDSPARQRYDVVYVVDERGWYYRYSHLFSIDGAIKPGARVKMGQKIGVLGKEGGSGGWSHLHFGIVSRQPSGEWGTQEAYAFAWEVYLRQYKPDIIAVARPHHLLAVGEKVTLDGSKSWSAGGRVVSYRWKFTDGSNATGATHERTYNKPGVYSEILRVENERGEVAYDFAVVQVVDPATPNELPPAIHPAYAPTTGIRPGDKVTFKVRTFGTTDGEEVWDFGDGTLPVKVKSDGNVVKLAKDGYAVTEHAFAKPGTYIVSVHRTNARGETATGHLAVEVEESGAELDAYGGWRDIQGLATGAFHIENINGRDLLITPDGHGFVALGVNHLSAIQANGENEPNLFRTRYQEDWKKFSEDVLRQYADWGLNTVDRTVEPLRDARPYLAANSFVRTAKYYGKPGENNPYDFPDIFDPEVKERLEREVAAYCGLHRGNKNLIAYYWTDTPTWDIHKTRRFRDTDWVSEIRKLPAHSPGRRRYAEFLRERYGDDVKRLSRVYGTSFENLDLTRYEVERDDQEFLGLIARTYYGIVGPAMRRNDPEHMVFGEKYLLGDTPRQVIEAAAPYLDAIAIQPGDGYIPIYTPGDIYPAEEIEALHKLTGKPIFICDHQISFATPRYPVAIWPYYQRANEAEAAAATERFLLEAFARPYILGYMRCQYIDRFTPRRNAIKLGLLRDDGSAYTHLVDATRRANRAVKKMVRRASLP